MWCRVGLVKADVLDELVDSIFRAERISELGTSSNFVPSSPIISTLIMEAIHYSETSLLTRATSQKTAFFIVTVAKTSNLTQKNFPHKIYLLQFVRNFVEEHSA
jgi:hypothetical protein